MTKRTWAGLASVIGVLGLVWLVWAGELGSGGGSSFPTAVDTNTSLEYDAPAANKTKARAAVPNDLGAAVVAIETELGTDPSGSTADVKTYLQTEHNTNGTHAAVTATSVSSTGGVDAGASGTFLKTKVINIGDWDMDTTQNITVAHGLTSANIRRVTVIIRNDDGSTTASLPFYLGGSTSTEGVSWTSTLISLSRATSGTFDGTNFDATSYNRGWIVIDYI